ncbi:hypothetical protein C5167_006087 [Papaver somniferum]|uniref:Uncharacterized protein n=1 Tax=Papaver somniferum TaxID=3469 RepID=A0A4Y7JGA3_PAPSO|nr:hypothetical protein C5167_006087 [Papaver somniferum]
MESKIWLCRDLQECEGVTVKKQFRCFWPNKSFILISVLSLWHMVINTKIKAVVTLAYGLQYAWPSSSDRPLLQIYTIGTSAFPFGQNLSLCIWASSHLISGLPNESL